MTEYLVRKYYQQRHCSCSLTVLRATFDLFRLKPAEKETVLLDRFCSWLKKSDDLCSAYTASIAMANLFYREEMAAVWDVSDLMKSMFMTEYGGCGCKHIRIRHVPQDVGCLHVLTKTVEMMQELLMNMGLDQFLAHTYE